MGLVRAGDDRAFELLYERYGTRVGAYVGGMVRDRGLAEDLTQEIFMSALRRMRETERPIAFRPWVYEIARNACIDQFRRTRRMEEVSYNGDDGLPGPDGGRGLTSAIAAPDDAFEAKEELTNLCSAFGGLSDSHHEILVLRELEGLSYREIGERMGLSRPAVESTLFRARRRLTEEYDELVSGRRCVRVQSILAGAAEGILGARDRRRLDRHLSHCQPCRRQALALGVEEVLPARRGALGRLAALLPVPWFMRRSRGGGGQTASSGAGGNPGAWAQWSTAVAPATEPIAATWKGVAAIAAIALAGVGTEAVRQGSPPPAKPVASAGTAERGGGPLESPGITALKIGSAAGTSKASRAAKGSETGRRAAERRTGVGYAGDGTASPTASAPGAAAPSPSWVGAPSADLTTASTPVAPSGPSTPSTPRVPGVDVSAPQVVPPAPPAAALPAAPTAAEAPSAPETPDASVTEGGVDAPDSAQLPTSTSKAKGDDEKSGNDEDDSKDGDEEKRDSGDDRDT